MAYLALPLCINNEPLPTHPPAKSLQTNEKMALITDVVVAILITTIGALALIQLNDLANLRALAGLGAIEPHAATAMITVGAGLVGADLIKLVIKQHSQLQALSQSPQTPAEPLEIEQLKSQTQNLEMENEKLAAKIMTLESEKSTIIQSVEATVKDLKEQLRQQTERASDLQEDLDEAQKSIKEKMSI